MNKANTKIISVQSEEFRQKVISTFCRYIFYSALASLLLYLFLQQYLVSSLTAGIGLFFLYMDRLNRKGHYNLSRYAIIGMTSLGLLMFSTIVGYESGIYLYLFITPLLVHLLFDFEKKLEFVTAISIYVTTFLVNYYLKDENFAWELSLKGHTQSLLYAFNFTSSIVLSFVLVSFMAQKNVSYIESIKEHREQLEKEIQIRKKQENELLQNVKEREVLLSEIHHRVRNNLAVIIGLLNLKRDKVKDELSKETLEEIKNKIYAMSLVHNQLYANESFETIDLEEFLSDFCSNLATSYKTQKYISLISEVERIDLSIHKAIPLALLLNELITNAFKHAFKEVENGEINLKVVALDDSRFKVQIRDNGSGMTQQIWNQENSGLMIAKSLTEQLEGELQFENDANNGSIFSFTVDRTT